MAHPFTVREIARQAGVSVTTVDRVLHGRPGGAVRDCRASAAGNSGLGSAATPNVAGGTPSHD
ncbi:LacI family DNA-binding transcriptional regulator [Arthrobacter crystallopoietes]|uniref:LacI family DNA-binding transcriptional regulator n=1 Tax=Crystallibacter crystallopoietes TaxID=37928 RepID=UPI001B8BE915|nr:LacI family DNA-binding transcriptional regulator [Arthrobacter crystallopoietes]